MNNGLKKEEETRLDLRFHDFLNNVWAVAKLEPREKYLYSVMRSVAFRDLEVALDIAMIEHETCKEDMPEHAPGSVRYAGADWSG